MKVPLVKKLNRKRSFATRWWPTFWPVRELCSGLRVVRKRYLGSKNETQARLMQKMKEREIRLSEVIKSLIEADPYLNITKLADQIGTNRNTLDNIVNTGAIPRGLTALIRLSERFGMSLDELVFGATHPTEHSTGQKLPVPSNEGDTINLYGKIQLTIQNSRELDLLKPQQK